MEGFIKYLTINTVCKLEASVYRSHTSVINLILRSTDDNMQDQHCSCITAYDYINVHLISLI